MKSHNNEENRRKNSEAKKLREKFSDRAGIESHIRAVLGKANNIQQLKQAFEYILIGDDSTTGIVNLKKIT